MNRDELEINELLELAVEFLNRGDLESLMKMWHTSATLMLPATPALSGKRSISKWLGNRMDTFHDQVEIVIDDIKPDGSLACVAGRFLIHIRNLLNNNLSIHNGKFLIVMYRNHSDLKDKDKPLWTIYCCCSNSSLPPVSTK